MSKKYVITAINNIICGFLINDGISEEVTYTIHFVVEQLNVIQDLTKFLYKVRKNYKYGILDKDGKVNLVVPSPPGDIKYVTIEKQNI